jgi:flagellar basal body-associated protein FliL
MRLMKRKIITALVVVAVVAAALGASVATKRHYDNYKQNKAAEEAKITNGVLDIERQKEEQHKAQVAELTANLQKENAECKKGKVAYDKLSVALKNQTPVPTCAAQ